jgi:hypothetical protein
VNAVRAAYVAGVLDAVGRVRVRELDNGTRLAVVAVSSPNLPLLRSLAELTGVRVVRVRRRYDRVGCETHCDKRHLHVVSDTGRWELVGARAAVVLRNVRPYVMRLGAEVDGVLAVTAGAPSKPATARKMVELGWAAA